MNIISYIVPVHFVPAILNGDPTGLSDKDEKELEQFLNSLPPGYFTLGDQVEHEFCYKNDVNNLGGDCLDLPYIVDYFLP